MSTKLLFSKVDFLVFFVCPPRFVRKVLPSSKLKANLLATICYTICSRVELAYVSNNCLKDTHLPGVLLLSLFIPVSRILCGRPIHIQLWGFQCCFPVLYRPLFTGKCFFPLGWNPSFLATIHSITIFVLFWLFFFFFFFFFFFLLLHVSIKRSHLWPTSTCHVRSMQTGRC